MPKDLFSLQSSAYAKYRPSYPKELFDYITSFVIEKKCAWDCATGNGQAAIALADFFQTVDATDISEAQLRNAFQKDNVHYQVASAEQTPFTDNSFDLITVGTAYHWLHWKAFYSEAKRVGKNNCVVAVWAYNLPSCTEEMIHKIIQRFYYSITKAYWDKERTHVDDSYKTVEFEFTPLPSKDFEMVLYWNREEFLGYLSSWSAVQNYVKYNNASPLISIEDDLNIAWPENDKKEFHFPLFMRIGRVTK